MPKLVPYKVGDFDKQGRKIVAVSPEGWYRCKDGSIRDADGFEWYGDKDNGGGIYETPQTKIAHDAVSGPQIVLRDFKIAMKDLSFTNPNDFIAHWRPTIESTMVETGWDYADVKEPIKFGETEDGFAHIYVQMKKKAWKNRENMYSGVKGGRDAVLKSPALIKAGALDPIIHGFVEDHREGGDIIANRNVK